MGSPLHNFRTDNLNLWMSANQATRQAMAGNYEYRPAANLVLQSERSGGRASYLERGEALTLAGRQLAPMGDRAREAKPFELREKLDKSRKRRERGEAELESAAALKRRQRPVAGGGAGFLSQLDALDASGYVPRTRETREAFEQLLTLVQGSLGDQPAEILHGAAVEVLSIMKADAAVETQKAAMVGSLLGGALSPDQFFRLTTTAKAITDYSEASAGGGGGGGSGGGGGGGGAGETVVAVGDDEDAEGEGERDDDGVVEDELDNEVDEEGGGGGVEEVMGGGLSSTSISTAFGREGGGEGGAGGGGGAGAGGPTDEEEEAAGLIPLVKIDAFWLQRELSKYYADALECQRVAAEALSILGSGLGGGGDGGAGRHMEEDDGSGGRGGGAGGVSEPADAREVENRLVALLDFDKFDVIKLLLRNAPRVYYVSRLRQAQTGEARAAVREAMAADPAHGGPSLLQRLDAQLSSVAWAASRAANVSERVKREAAQLARGANAAEAAAAAARDGEDVAVMLARGSATVITGASGGSGGGGGITVRAPGGASVAGSSAASAFGGAPSTARSSGGGGGSEPANPGQRLLDLDSLSFANGAHTMTNKKVVLVEDSWRVQKKGYEEVHVPALKPRPFMAGEREIPIKELPDWAQPAFAGMTKLNRVQSKLAPTALQTPENMLLCAPTGAGKTNVAMLTILQVLGSHRLPAGGFDLAAFKIVYVAPMKALVQEVVANFSQRLTAAYGIKVRELSGDASLTKAEIADTQIIVTTPEKWDVVTRKASERAYTALVKLIIIDEVHLLHDERGAVLEALVARTLRQVEATRDFVRIVGLSATLPNFEDVATFLRVRPESGLFYFDGSFRPCPLQQQYIGVTEKKAARKLALMNEICFEKVKEQAGKSQVIIFVHTRKDTGRTARALKEAFLNADALGKLLREDSASREVLQSETENTAVDAELKELLPFGFAIHHAGMKRSDRTLVEELFADGHTQVLVSTATLAWGVNLPAHTVIIKGTQVYNPEKGRWCELSPLDIMQMLGRAGRPQFDTFGEGIIITAHSELQYYLSLMNQQLPIESQLMLRLADLLNAEVVAGTVTSVREAAAWLGYTYLYVRMMRSPALYGVEGCAPPPLGAAPGAAHSPPPGDPLLLQRRLDLAHSAALLLDKHNLLRYDRRSGAFQTTALGRVASFYYVTHATIASFNQFLKPTLADLELLRLFSLASEFKNVVVRAEEKDELRKLLERVPIPVKESIEEPSSKVNVLLQAYISRLRMDGFAIAADMVFVQQSAGRLARALFEICLRRSWASLARRTLELCKTIDRRQWASASPLRQFTPAQGGLSEDVLRKLENKALPWARYYDLSSTELGEMVRLAKLGKPLHKLVHTVPRLDAQVRLLPVTRALLRLDVTLTPDFIWDARSHGGVEEFWVLVEDADGETILHAEPFALKARYAEEEHPLSFTVPVTEPLPPHFFLRVLSNRWLHSETLLPIPFARLALPEKFPPPRELLDLAPLPVGALHAPAFEALFTSGRAASDSPASRLAVFNAIQTQAFPALFGGDANALVAAPSGSGKTVCAEFALLRLWGSAPNARAVYIAPHAAGVRARYEDWELRFGDRGLGKAVVELTGDLQADLKLLEGAHLVLATPPHWDAISRRWKKRRAVQDVRLYVCDELHFIGCPEVGATYEAVVMRVRFSSAELVAAGKPAPRIVGLAASLANFRDVAEWLGVAPGETLAFHPAHRPVPLEVRIQGLDVADYSARLLAMARPAYTAAAAAASAPGAAALVFVPSRRQAQVTAIDMLAAAAADGAADRFLRGRASAEDVEAAVVAAGVGDETLRSCLRAGVGYTYEGQAPGERTLVERLFAGGALGVAVAPAAAARGMDASTWGAHCVVVMGTEVWDGKEHRLVDLPVADVLHMTGRACRGAPGGGAPAAKCLLLCAANRKEFVKTFLYEPLPVESVLAGALHNHVNAEVVNGVIESKQDALDYLTWTFLYRRLPANPNWYNLPGASHKQLSDYLSDLVDTVVGDLATSQCVAVAEDEVGLSPQSLGSIAAYYYVGYATLEVFATSLTPKTKIRGLLEILSNAAEFDALPLRHGEDRALRAMALHAALPLPPPAPPLTDATRFSDPHAKANLLLQAHLSRRHLGSDMALDRDWLLERAVVLVKAMVDVISQEGWLKPALAAMELSQMLVQALWVDKDSPLLQVPHVTAEAVAALGAALEAAGAPPAEGVFDLAAVEPGLRARALGLPPHQLADVARFCNRFPSIEVGVEVEGGDSVRAGDGVALRVTLAREAGAEGLDEGAGLGAVIAHRFPGAKSEGWWLVVGQPAANALTCIKKVPLAQAASVRLEFNAPTAAGPAAFKLYLMSDSYVGVDQELDVELNVLPGEDGMA